MIQRRVNSADVDPAQLLAGDAPADPVLLSSENHRTRVGAQRRERTRLLLLKSALQVLSKKGPDATVIDDVIAVAGLSRGTFYNHFRTANDLLLALANAMSDEVLAVLKPVVLTFDDPVHRFSMGTRLYMRVAVQYPAWGRFITNVGANIVMRGQHFDENVTRDLTLAFERKRIITPNLLVARTIVMGSIIYGIETMLSEPSQEEFSENIVATFLRGMGMPAGEADQIAYMQLPNIGPITGSIFSTLPKPRSSTVAIKQVHAAKPRRSGTRAAK